MRGAGLRGVVVVAVVAIAVPTALAGSRAAADPMRMLLTRGDVPTAPYDESRTLRSAQVRGELLALTVKSGAAARRVAGSSRCGARYFTTDTASGEKQAFSYVCVTGSAADAEVLARALMAKRKDFLSQPATCQSQSPTLGQSAGLFRWCPYKPNTRFWSTSYLGIWSYENVVAVYGYEYPLIANRPSLQVVLRGLTRLSARIRAS